MRWLSVALFVGFVPLSAQAALQNQLKHHPSPYLALHGTDPTAWQEWNKETVARARKENKLFLVSIGYFSCHWCHVMQRESFKNPEIAKWLNERFIPVKVDREINGALDAELQAFAEATRKQAGWPLNVFVTPEGYPLFAMLYAPPQEFLEIVTKLDARWQTDNQQLKKLAQSAAQEMPAPQQVEAKFALHLAPLYRQRMVNEALAQADMFRGGFGEVNKFPQSPQLLALLEAQRQAPNAKLAEFLRLTLDRMAQLGLYDAVGGGFFRYTVDPDWHIPHFEKMLYDNAQLALVYLHAAKTLNQPAYRHVAFETLDFMLTGMRDAASGALITSTSAVDDQDREGGVYLWDKATLQQLLPAADLPLLEKFWGTNRPPEIEHGYLPLHLVQPNAQEAARLQALYAKLKTERAKRILPKDDKLLAGLNGLSLMALSEAASLEPRFKPAAKQVRDFLADKLMTPAGLLKGYAQGKPLGPADLEDYAYVSSGLLAYARMTNSDADRELARKLVNQAWQLFHGPRGWKLEQEPLLAQPYYQRVVPDGATFSPASLLVKSSWELGGKELRAHALKALNVGYATLDQGAFWYATQVRAMNALK